jgi:hypothetical protein
VRLRLSIVIATLVAAGIACGLTLTGQGDGASTPDDAALQDAASPDAVVDASPEAEAGAIAVRCLGVQVDASDCSSCTDRFLCGEQCLGSCQDCDAASLPCVRCNATGSAFGWCQGADQDGVLRCAIAATERCPCDSGSTSGCPYLGEVCPNADSAADFTCFTCLEPGSVGLYCRHDPQNGARCQSDGACE